MVLGVIFLLCPTFPQLLGSAVNPSSNARLHSQLAVCGALLSLLSADGTRQLVLQIDLSDHVQWLN